MAHDLLRGRVSVGDSFGHERAVVPPPSLHADAVPG